MIKRNQNTRDVECHKCTNWKHIESNTIDDLYSPQMMNRPISDEAFHDTLFQFFSVMLEYSLALFVYIKKNKIFEYFLPRNMKKMKRNVYPLSFNIRI